ncbi:endonuclease domain-containing protein [Agromyces rhizosphaerae]|nr:DUF559 domain-containing protein [Agromyces rhizosphaerae]
MRDLAMDLSRFGGLATQPQLRRLGHSERAIREAVAAGSAWRVGRSWLANARAEAEAVRAVALRGVLGGESALRSHGVWVTHETGLCVVSPRSASRLPSTRAGEYRIRVERIARDGERRWRVDVGTALVQALPRFRTRYEAIATLDSALHARRIDRRRLEVVAAGMPRRIRRLLPHLDPRAESGLESILRLAALERGWSVRSQVRIAGVGRVDLVIDGWLVIEADGARWHDDPADAARDRERNAALVRRGYRWHRFGHAQVVHDLDGCLEVIAALLAHGRPAR